MNRGGDGSRRKRTSSAHRQGSRTARPASGSIGARISELEHALLARKMDAKTSSQAPAPSPFVDSRNGRCESRSGRESVLGTAPTEPAELPEDCGTGPSAGWIARPSSSLGRPQAHHSGARPSSSLGRKAPFNGIGAPAALVEEAKAMCQGARSNQAVDHNPEPSSLVCTPRQLARPNAPTPEQTTYWLQGMDQANSPKIQSPCGVEPRALVSPSRSPSPDSPRPGVALLRPRSPTPTKMLAWEESQNGRATAVCPSGGGSPGDSDREGRGDHTDGLIARLIGACQLNEVNRAFTLYEKLRKMRVPLYEGVYKLIIECCMRTQQLGHAMQFYETLKSSGQKVSARLVVVLIEACAKEQHGDKVHAIWNDWCPPDEPISLRIERCCSSLCPH